MENKSKNLISNRTIIYGAIWLILMPLIAGCNYGKVRYSDIPVDNVIVFMEENYDRFEFAYSGEKYKPAAIRLDPKDDPITLTGDGWYPVESRDELKNLVAYVIAKYRYWEGGYWGPYLFEIQDETGQTIGYYYSILDHTIVQPDGGNYRVDPITRADIVEAGLPSIRGAGG